VFVSLRGFAIVPIWAKEAVKRFHEYIAISNIAPHEEIRNILIVNENAWLTTREIAEQVNRRGRYRKKYRSEVTDYQIHGRTKNCHHLFERKGSLVRCLQLP